MDGEGRRVSAATMILGGIALGILLASRNDQDPPSGAE
jgi:hypothetical protein